MSVWSAPVLEALAKPGAYPDDASATAGVAWIQTHLSHVFLTGERVYKFRKDVDLGFVDFRTLEERNCDCLREVALNRRLAPDVYLGVAPLRTHHGSVRLGPIAEELAESGLEHAVVMRRLPDGCDALSRLAGGTLSAEHLDRLVQRIAAFHRENALGAPAPFSAEEWLARCRRPVDDCIVSLASGGDAAQRSAVERLRSLVDGFLEAHADRFERRRLAGRAVDGHGDLHLQHVWFERDDAEPLVVDCLEFDERLRRIDAASDVAFTAMDLCYRGAARHADRWLRHYARERDDFDLYGVVDYFVAYRASVRAKVAAIAARDGAIEPPQRAAAAESVARHLQLATASLAPRPVGALVLVAGVVGTGKTTVAEALAEALAESPGAAVLATDRIRKHLAGVAPQERLISGTDEGMYAPELREQVYRALLERTAPVASAGRIAILDATWEGRADRRRAADLAADLGARLWVLEVRCAPELVLERLAARRAEARDASDAGPELYAASRDRFEAATGSERAYWRTIETDGSGWRDAVHGLAKEMR